MDDILKILEKDATLTPEALAKMCNRTPEEIRAMIAEWEKQGVILGRRTLVDWERAGEEKARAMIEVKIDHRGAYAYDKLAERIRNYPEVKSLYLMSGTYDFLVVVEGKSLKEVAFFVSDKLSSQEIVTATATHFVMNTYKENHVMFKVPTADERINELL
ncbi:MAG: Lrp/AsnC family transcriptional regulator [Clostridia bacterium]|nr:Lrp/AsnC family transcriptional regulator [Clostridia bacterium]